jgi:hypothetical protein
LIDIGHYKYTIDYNCIPLFGTLISQKYATLKELQEHYTYEDCLMINDVIATDYYNKRTIEMSVKKYQDATRG